MLELVQGAAQLMDVVVPQDEAPDDPVVGIIRVQSDGLLDLRNGLRVLIPLEQGERPVPVAAMVGQTATLLERVVDKCLLLLLLLTQFLRHLDASEVDLRFFADGQRHLIPLVHVEDES